MLYYIQSHAAWILRKSFFIIVVSAFVLLVATVFVLAQSYFSQLENEIERLSEQEELLARTTEIQKEVQHLKSSAKSIQEEMKRRAENSKKWLGLLSLLQNWGLSVRESETIEELSMQAREITETLSRREDEFRTLADQLGDDISNLEEAREQSQNRLKEAREELATWNRRLDIVLQSMGNAWQLVGKGLILFAIFVIFGPFVGRVMQYYLLAPLMSMASPIQLAKGKETGRLRFTEGGKATSISIHPQQSLHIHHEFLHGDSTTPEAGTEEEKMIVQTRWILNRRYWFTCMAARLCGITEITNQSSSPLRVTLSQSKDPNEEVSLLELPDENCSVIMLPSHLAGILCPSGQSPRLCSHWVWRHLHAWIAGRFRYIEIFGPATLVLHGTRGLKREEVGDVAQGHPGHWKNNRNVTVAFSPHLLFASRRAETFFSYLRGANPLFDQRFQGCGMVVTQQASPDRRNGLQRVFQGFWDGILRALGI
jgi:uncharacterized protein YlxW (UPF0749 family)